MLNDVTKIIDVEVELTTLCNAKCPLCYRNYKTFKSHYPKNVSRPLKDVIEQLQQYTSLKFLRIVGSVSEPTLYRDLFKLLDYAKNRGVMVEICTNGSTYNPQYWRELGRHLTLDDRVYFTICGSSQEVHEKYRRGTSLEKILENARALRSVLPIDYAQCIQFFYNYQDLNSEKFQEMVSEFSHLYMTKTFYPKEQDNYAEPFDSQNFLPNEDELPKYKKVYDLANKYPYSKRDCKAFNQKWNQIDVYGRVFPCYLLLEGLKGEEWNHNWSEILDGKYETCKFCSKILKPIIDKDNLVYII